MIDFLRLYIFCYENERNHAPSADNLLYSYIADLPRNICEPGASSRKLNTKDRKEKKKNLT